MLTKPYSESCDQNKLHILEVLAPYLEDGINVLEIGSGTGQHGLFFASEAAQITWQASDLAGNLPGIRAWQAASNLPNLPNPVELDVTGHWPEQVYELLFSANTFHIMNREQVEQCLLHSVDCLKPGGHFVVYGPFNYGGNYTSDSNERFDCWLNSRDPESGIKDFEWLESIANRAGYRLIADIAMPANNRTLVWRYETFTDES
jgi:cyclopropane fatty-acyl-phospholipid synthase-like methyltransferase